MVSPRLSAIDPRLGISARISVNSFCSLALRAASAPAATRAASAAVVRSAKPITSYFGGL